MNLGLGILYCSGYSIYFYVFKFLFFNRRSIKRESSEFYAFKSFNCLLAKLQIIFNVFSALYILNIYIKHGIDTLRMSEFYF